MKTKLVSFGILCTILLIPTIASAEIVEGGDETAIEQFKTILSMVIGLISLIIGGLSLSGFIRLSNNGRKRVILAVAAIVLGVYSIFIGGRHLFDAYGFFGTGYGQAGAIAAIVLGLIGIIFACLTLVRYRRKN